MQDTAAGTLSIQLDDSTVRRQLVEMLSQDDVDSRIMQSGVRISYVGQEYSNINYLIRHRTKNPHVHHFPANQISRHYTSHELDRIPKDAFVLPSRTLVDELLDQYFRHVNPGFPILDEDIFMRQYRAQNPQDPPSLLVLQSVLMVGAHVARDRPERESLKAMFFRRAKMLFDARYEWNRDVVVQAALLLTWHSEGIEDVGANSYYWVGIAARTALGLGMHRDCSSSTLVAHDKRIWRRVFWVLVQFDVMVSLSYGRPQAINLDECDVAPLTVADLEGVGRLAQVEFVIQYTDLCSKMSRIMRDHFRLNKSDKVHQKSLAIADEILADWWSCLPSHMRSRSAYSSIWPKVLLLAYNNFLILLHRPLPGKAAVGGVFRSHDSDICSSAAKTITDLFDQLRENNEIRFLWVSSVNVLFTTLIQLSAEMRTANPILAVDALRKFDIALDSLRTLAEYWLNADIILRLFEESSERLQQELKIGKARKLPHITPQDQETSPGVVEGSSASEGDNDDHDDNPDCSEISKIDWRDLYSYNQDVLQTAGAQNAEADGGIQFWDNSGLFLADPFEPFPFPS
ncbi:Fungal specific transcription factor domain-containing protein [Cladophialophora immunda]|nr:Fungal specific transcription factor domain-containing protein [Cladophialophora immunda]